MKRTLQALVFLLGSLSYSALGPSLPAQAEAAQLQSGVYFAQGSMFARSYRAVARKGDRLCIKIVNGPPNPYEGDSTITLSTVTQQSGQAIVTATQSPLTVRSPQSFVIEDGRLGLWELSTYVQQDAALQQKLSTGLQACLDGQGDYAQQQKGPFISGQIYPAAPGQLIAQQAKARINVRQEPGLQAKILHYGLAGDRVQLLQSRYDEAGGLWYEVRFDVSGATGWVRRDFVRRLK